MDNRLLNDFYFRDEVSRKRQEFIHRLVEDKYRELLSQGLKNMFRRYNYMLRSCAMVYCRVCGEVKDRELDHLQCIDKKYDEWREGVKKKHGVDLPKYWFPVEYNPPDLESVMDKILSPAVYIRFYDKKVKEDGEGLITRKIQEEGVFHKGCGGYLEGYILEDGLHINCVRCHKNWCSNPDEKLLIKYIFLRYFSLVFEPHIDIYEPRDEAIEKYKRDIEEAIAREFDDVERQSKTSIERYIDGEYRIVKARKPHRCVLCGKPIEAGKQYYLIRYRGYTSYYRRAGKTSVVPYILVTKKRWFEEPYHVKCLEEWLRETGD